MASRNSKMECCTLQLEFRKLCLSGLQYSSFPVQVVRILEFSDCYQTYLLIYTISYFSFYFFGQNSDIDLREFLYKQNDFVSLHSNILSLKCQNGIKYSNTGQWGCMQYKKHSYLLFYCMVQFKQLRSICTQLDLLLVPSLLLTKPVQCKARFLPHSVLVTFPY